MFRWYLKQVIRRGRMAMIEPNGRRTEFGEPGTGPLVTIHILTPQWLRRITLNPNLAFGEAYMEGGLVVLNGTIRDVLNILFDNFADAILLPQERLIRALRPALRRLQQYNPVRRAGRNVAHHYDLSARLYELFLDSDRQYSCAYFSDPGMSLEAAQEAKKRHIIAKLKIEPGMRVLDIGSGWGGLALGIARLADVDVTGLTLSREQLVVSNERARAQGLADRVRFHLRDYRAETGTYDRIVSVGMFEHVGTDYFPAYFEAVKRLMAPNGVMLLHSIGRRDGPGTTNAWLRKYIFPGGYAPALSEVVPVIEATGLWITDIEILRLHYAMTIEHWQRRFAANRAEIARLYDERFCRMWEFYLAGAELDFRYLHAMNFQIQISNAIDALPITRDYAVDWERAVDRERADAATVAALAAAAPVRLTGSPRAR